MCHLLCKMALAVVYFMKQQLISHTLKKIKKINHLVNLLHRGSPACFCLDVLLQRDELELI